MSGKHNAGHASSSEDVSSSRLLFLNERYKALVESTDDWLWEVDEQMRFTYSSPQAGKMLGCNPEDLIGQRLWDHMSQEEAKRLEAICSPLVKTRQKINLVEYHVYPGNNRSNKRYIESSATPFFDSSGIFRGYRGLDRDITLRKQLEVNRQNFQDMLAQVEEAGLILDKDAKITYLNENFYRLFGYTPEEILNKPISILDPESDSTAIPTSEVIERLKIAGYWEGETKRLTKSRKKISIFLKVKALKDEDDNFIGYLGTYFDLTPYKKSEKILRKTLSSAIHAISITVEKRDPYTYGHQQRVAWLCVKIARALGKSTDFIRGLEMGAMIHDIGKIHIPGEILNRPGKLTEHEKGMIKTHSMVGYEVVKDLEFPWPIADMILQHHEWLDGSGYPGGSINGAIIPEARIIAVADVLEAMTTHRPYRPARHISIGMKELQDHSGSAYDAEVVEACLGICSKKSFSFG